MKLPTLETDHLILRSLTTADAAQVFAYAGDERVARMTHWNRHQSLRDTRAFIARNGAHTMIWGIEHKESRTIIGECGLTHITQARADIYYALGYNWWGKGLAPQAVNAVIDYSFHELRLTQLDAWILKENTRSHRVAQKVGMECMMKYPQHWYANHTLHDVYLYTKQQ